MRAIMWADLDTRRPVLILTRPEAGRYLRNVTVAPITSRVRGIAVEVPVGPENGLGRDSVVNLDNVTTVPRDRLGANIGYFGEAQESALLAALQAAFGLLPPPRP